MSNLAAPGYTCSIENQWQHSMDVKRKQQDELTKA